MSNADGRESSGKAEQRCDLIARYTSLRRPDAYLCRRLEPVLAAEGAIALLERISPALEHVDSSSGAIGSAVNRTIAEHVPVIARAPADAGTRAAWLDRLFEAHGADQIPYIEQLAEYWGELCGSRELASEWADRLILITRRIRALFDDPAARSGFVASVIGKDVGLD